MVLGEPGRRFLWHKIYLFALLEGLFTSLKLFPFMFRGDVNVTSYDETGALDTVIEMGIYKVKPKQGVWGTLWLKKASVWSSRNSRGQTFWRQFHYSNSLWHQQSCFFAEESRGRSLERMDTGIIVHQESQKLILPFTGNWHRDSFLYSIYGL